MNIVLRWALLPAFLLVAAAAAANVPAGVQKWRAGDWAGAIAEWQTPAARGDADAMFNMGQAYRLGRGVPQNNQTALEYYRRASEKGHVAATANLGITLFQEGRRTEAMTYLRSAADKGDLRASFVMGIATFNGDGAARNPVLGYAYMLRAREGSMQQADQQAARMATLLSPSERARAEAAAAALAAGEPVPVELISPGGRAPEPVVTAGATEDSGEESAESDSAAPEADKPVRVADRPVRVADRPADKAPEKAVKTEKSVRAEKAEPTPAAAAWRVQLGAYASEQAARTAWATLVAQSAGLLKGQKPNYVQRGRLVTLQVGAFTERDAARNLCAELAAAGRPCFVTKG